jgi:hypothetical protein
MITGTLLAVLLVPVFYVVVRKIVTRREKKPAELPIDPALAPGE